MLAAAAAAGVAAGADVAVAGCSEACATLSSVEGRGVGVTVGTGTVTCDGRRATGGGAVIGLVEGVGLGLGFGLGFGLGATRALVEIGGAVSALGAACLAAGVAACATSVAAEATCSAAARLPGVKEGAVWMAPSTCRGDGLVRVCSEDWAGSTAVGLVSAGDSDTGSAASRWSSKAALDAQQGEMRGQSTSQLDQNHLKACQQPLPAQQQTIWTGTYAASSSSPSMSANRSSVELLNRPASKQATPLNACRHDVNLATYGCQGRQSAHVWRLLAAPAG